MNRWFFNKYEILRNGFYMLGRFFFSRLFRNQIILIALVIVVLLNLYYLNTYPVNIAAYDYPNYAGMIYSGSSNLIHASGYAWIMRTFLDVLNISNQVDRFSTSWLENIQLINFSLHLILIAICSLICNKVFGRLSAALMCLAWGGSLFFMGGVNAVSPDWLQGDLLASALLTALWAFNVKNHAKIILYVISALILTLAYLVKFNSLVVAPIIALLVLFDSKDFIWKVTTALVSFAASAALIFLFIENFHYPSTNTRQLSYDHAWVLIDSLPSNYINQEPSKLGINSLRWRALGAILPPDYFRAAAYQDVDWGAPEEIREPYLAQFNYLMNASRLDLISFAKTYPLPDAYNVDVSAIPGYYYIGLPQIDSLGIAVYKESIVSSPSAYIEKFYKGILHFFSGQPTQLTPLKSNGLGLVMGSKIAEDGSVKLSVPMGRMPQHMIYWNPAEKVNVHGITFFELMYTLTPPAWFYAILAFVSCVVIVNTQTIRKSFQACLLLLSTILLMSSSLMLLGIRFKEILALLPVTSIFLGFGVSSLILYFKERYTKASMLNLNGESI
ncbi:hypothetical protein SAMN05216264_11788 [Pseudomonas marincola]|nr:hypothetical protein SAMN05216264_11788 [Pseudomonas marincola]